MGKAIAWAHVAALVWVAGCGGNLTTGAPHDSNAPDAAGQTLPQADGATAVGDGRNPYIPSDGALPVDDADPTVGPLDTPGLGFDFCPTRTPGQVTLADIPSPSQGKAYARFESGRCESPCSPQGSSEAQIYVWPGDSNDIVTGLYFDVIDLFIPEIGESPSSGSLRVYSTDQTCQADMLLTDVQLSALGIGRTWSTRCIPLRPGTREAIGIAVTGFYDIGIDAIRFGPACR